MEYLDVLDKNGSPTGEKKSKADIHRDGDWHRVVHVWVLNSNQELLVQKRSEKMDTDPNLWDISSAGHVSADETSLIAAIRETGEELGLKLSSYDFEYLFTLTQQAILHGGTYINNEFSDVYLVTGDYNLAAFTLQKDELSGVKWIPYKELKQLATVGDPEFVSHPREYAMLLAELHKRCG